MSVGARIKIARLAAGMSTKTLADLVQVTKQAISKYERDLDMPSSAVLLRLARALGVSVDYFFRPQSVDVALTAYRRDSSLPARVGRRILEQARDLLERYLEVENILSTGETPGFQFPDGFPYELHRSEDAEDAAQKLRKAWDLGVDPIENLTDVLEDHGLRVVMVDRHKDFDGCTLEANGNIPVIAVAKGLPGDRQRFTIAHELGHIMLRMSSNSKGLDEEGTINRFAAAFLVPCERARYELGEKRRNLSPDELFLLKHKYGLSMKAWVHRADELGIISHYQKRKLFQLFKQHGWNTQEPGEQIPSEKPKRMKLLVERALAEGLISQSKAAELIGEPVFASGPTG